MLNLGGKTQGSRGLHNTDICMCINIYVCNVYIMNVCVGRGYDNNEGCVQSQVGVWGDSCEQDSRFPGN